MLTFAIIYILCLLFWPEFTVYTTIIVGGLAAMAALLATLHFLPISALIGA